MVEYSSFKFGDFNSLDNGIYIEANRTYPSAQMRGEYVEIAGVDGELYKTDLSFNNVKRSVNIYIKKGTEQEVINKLNVKLVRGKWLDLSFSNEPDYIYKAIFVDEYEVIENLNSYAKSVLTFILKPYKYLKSSMTEIVLPAQITNQTNRIAKPIIKIKGSGNITIAIGNSQLSLKNVDGGVIVDSLAQTITTLDASRSQFEKMTSYPFPVIYPGKQNILTTGTINECKIIPRFEVLT